MLRGTTFTLLLALVLVAGASAAPPNPPSPLHAPPLPFRHPARVTVSREGAIKVTVSGVVSGRGYLSVSAYYGKEAPNLREYGGAMHDVANVRKATITVHPNQDAKRALRALRRDARSPSGSPSR